jgi:hypothetical protein
MYRNVPRSAPCVVNSGGVVGQRRQARGDGGRGGFREAEVEQPRAGLREHHVGRLRVAMDDVRAVERVADFDADPQRPRGRIYSECATLGSRGGSDVHSQLQKSVRNPPLSR